MTTDPILGSFVWFTASVAFLAAGSAVVRMLDGRAGSADPHEDASR